MGAPKGTRPPNAGKGRKKGVPNKLTAALKDVILGALADAGGQGYLKAQAKKNPQAFMSLVGRVLPLQIKDGGKEPQMPKQVQHLHPDSQKP